MSCGGLHEDSIGEHLHAPGDHDAGPVEDVAVDGPDTAEAAVVPPTLAERAGAAVSAAGRRAGGRVSTAAAGTWHQQGYLAKPYLIGIPLAEGAVFIGHAATGGGFPGVIAAGITGLAAEVGTEIANSKQKRSDAVRDRMRRTLMVGTVWAAVADGWTPVGPGHVLLWASLAGGVVTATIHARAARKARKDARVKPALEQPAALAIEPQKADDPRLVAFRDRFCAPDRELAGTRTEFAGATAVGFILLLHFPASHARRSNYNRDTVDGLNIEIGKLYGVTRTAITTDYIPGEEHEGACQLIVRTAGTQTVTERAAEGSVTRWDGKSSWNPKTGTIDLGQFEDTATTHYRLNEPGSGTWHGAVAGAQRAGKTTTISIITAEAGLATLCSRCRAFHTCTEGCDPRRVFATWVGDAQGGKGLGVWGGRADLCGWGPGGCTELLHLATTVGRARIEQNKHLIWYDQGPDGRRRENRGRPTFDPIPGYPGILLVLDELRELIEAPDQEMAAVALKMLIDGIPSWPKVGIHVLIGTHLLDVSFTGDRAVRELLSAMNLVAHRLDATSSNMGGITGDPTTLLHDERGSGFTSIYDKRPGTKFLAKFARDYNPPEVTGVDLRHLAGQIATTPIDYDDAVVQSMEVHGLTHQQVITEWGGRAEDEQPSPDATVIDLASAPSAQKAATAAPAAPVPVTTVGIDGLPTAEEAGQVKTVLMGQPGADTRALMEATGLSMLTVKRALDWLVINNLATCETTPDGRRYTAAA